jgi:hypothetical protein
VAFYLFTSTPPPLLNIDRAREELLQSPIVGGNAALVEHVLRLLDGDPKTRPDTCTAWLHGLDDLAEPAAPAAGTTVSGAPAPGTTIDGAGLAPPPPMAPMAPTPAPGAPGVPTGAGDQGWQVPAAAPGGPAPMAPPPMAAPPGAAPMPPPAMAGAPAMEPIGGHPIPGQPVGAPPAKKGKGALIFVLALVVIAIIVAVVLVVLAGR